MKQTAFSAFPKEGVQFLRRLKRNNNREWFQEHKTIYEESVKRPMTELIAAIAVDFQKFAPEMIASPKVSAYRIYRDTRFSRDKSPYKTHVAAVFPRARLGKHEGAGFYLHIAPSELLIGGGLYMPMPEELNAVRHRIAADPAAFLKIVRNSRFRKFFEKVSGEQLSRVPRGFVADHPAADYLRHKQFLVTRTFPVETASKPSFYKLVVETFQAMVPFIRFLNEPIVRARSARERQEALMKGDVMIHGVERRITSR
jgi:uncharacterized protein (TIGR02453 family)